MNLIEYPDVEMMMIDLAQKLVGELNSCLMQHDWASFAVPGGTTPGPIFDVMCAADLDWERVHVMLTDERWVPEHDARSNTRLLRERLLVERAAKAQSVPLYADAPQPEDKLDQLTKAIAPELPISVMLLGMGADMHTASLFPGADRLADGLAEDAPVLLPMRADGAPEPRITLTMPVLKGAMSRHLVITGADKREALERAKGLSPLEAPVAAILPGTTVHWAET
ncbi:MAG: 6-phosphogluconolactonase [Pseudomonadota bacterium]